MLLSDGWLEEFQQCIIRKHNGHTLRWRYDYSHTPRPCRHLVTASLCFRGLFFWDALYTRNRDSERAMINATILERRFERRLQTRFGYGYWNVILLLEKVINAPIVSYHVIWYRKTYSRIHHCNVTRSNPFICIILDFIFPNDFTFPNEFIQI